MNVTIEAHTTPNYDAIKTKQNVAWGSGDYAKIGVTLQIVGEELAEAMDLASNATVLDVAAGNGNITLALARRWCRVTSTDYVDTLLNHGRIRAEAEGLDVEFQIADAENLPFQDGQFDAVASTFGIMFAPNQEQAATEMQRVCRAGGTIGMANWTADGFIGQLFKTLGGHIAPPVGVKSPALWGDRQWVEEAFGDESVSISYNPCRFNFRYHSPQHFVDFFRTFYGPVHKAFLALEPAAQDALEADILGLVGTFNTANDGSMRVPSEYAEIVITKT